MLEFREYQATSTVFPVGTYYDIIQSIPGMFHGISAIY